MKVIIDHIGRTVLGTLESETDTHLTLNNPVIFHVQPNPQTGQLQVQSFPYIFMEVLDPESRTSNFWTFNKDSIVTSNVTFDSKIIAQYNNFNTPAITPPESEPQVIKLFDE
jgi:hypothetical protein